MGVKGSWRRPAVIGDKRLTDNWNRVFGRGEVPCTCGDHRPHEHTPPAIEIAPQPSEH